MSGQYPYGAPPPPPPPSSAPVSSYPYGQQSYSPAPRGGSSVAAGGGRARSYTQGPSRADYGTPYGAYPQQDFASQNAASYGQQPASGYWNGNPPHSNSPLPQSNYHPNYVPQSTYPPQPPTTFQPAAYHASSQRPAYTAAYNSSTPDYSAQQWNDSSSPYSAYSARGGRGGYSGGDRGGHRADSGSPALRMGYDQGSGHTTQASNGYSQQYPPPHHSTPAYSAPYPTYPPAVPAYPGPAPPAAAYSHNSHNHRGRGRDGFSGHSRGRGGHHNDRNDKFRHKGQRPQHHDNHSAQKSDAASAKKKKRKTNTLGLTPGDADDSDKEIDEEQRIVATLGDDIPEINDLAAWLAERRAKFPTKARVRAKQEADAAKRAEAGEDQKPVPKNKDEERAEKLRRQLAKVERKLEKRKRETNDEGDEMRITQDESDSSSSSDDEPPEMQTTKKTSSYLPPPPITRADPTAHCKYYSTGGVCGKKGKCRFVHDPEIREKALQEQAANGGRITLKQRLLRNEKEIEDLAIIQSIVSLRGTGKMPPAPKPAAKAPGSSTRTAPIPLSHIHHTEPKNSSGQASISASDSDSPPVDSPEAKVKWSWAKELYANGRVGYQHQTVQQKLDKLRSASRRDHPA
ncbi:hypothetical protein AB5N19_05544 [Seiridium cardinale]|uniref:C3H1-type domain-containing protein n=1 Tax=Seiridium cardinale TaxID=138064 RepID=A0ABR2XDP0_9PEZI